MPIPLRGAAYSQERAAVLCRVMLTAAFALSTRAGEMEFAFPSTLDGSRQLAMAYVPDACRDQASPLLVVAHPMGGSRRSAGNLGYYDEAERRGWIVVCPELHGRRTGGATSLAAPEAQRDIIDAIDHLSATCRVDRSRVYLAGRSMGGMLALLVAAKYPDRFAAVVAGQGISDLAAWTRAAPPNIRELIERECLPHGPETRFDYERRSPIQYAPNLAHVPLILWHGSLDELVPPAHSETLTEAIRRHNPRQEPIHWLHGAGHNPINYPPRWICDQLEYYVNTCDGVMRERTRFYRGLTLVVDEPRTIFWLTIEPAAEDRFAEVQAAIRDGALVVRATGAQRVAVDLDRLTAGTVFSRLEAKSDGALALELTRGGAVCFSLACGRRAAAGVPEAVWQSGVMRTSAE